MVQERSHIYTYTYITKTNQTHKIKQENTKEANTKENHGNSLNKM